MPSPIGKCKLFRIKHTTLLEGETFLRNKHKMHFFKIKCTFFVIKESTINKGHIVEATYIHTYIIGHVEATSVKKLLFLSKRLFFLLGSVLAY